MSETLSPAPSVRYQEGVAAHRWEADTAQLAVLPEFDRLHAALGAAPPRDSGLFGRLKSLLASEPAAA
ncbi:MAG: cell division protein ZapE, partial [Xanthomonadaceae bacterium]|nr:cell division protein ZapE [Xanthomonadaceae bacterium]